MAYVGNTPADKTLKLEKQQFTTSATTSYTLDHSVSDPQDIALFINNVRQNPNSSYTVSGTALTLSAATASTDTMYCVFLGRAIGTVGIGAGSVTKDKVDFISDGTGSGVISKGDGSSIDGSIQLNCHVNSHGIKLKSPPHSAGATYTLTFPNSISADKFLKTDGSGNLSFADAGGNTPAFHAYLSSDQSISPSTIVKAQLNTEVLDTDNAYDNSTNYRFTCPTAGKYFIYAGLQITQSAYHMYNIGLLLYKNGTQYFNTNNVTANNVSFRDTITTTQIIDLAQNDYLELFGYLDYHAGSGYEFEHNKKACYLGGYLLGGA